MWYIIPQFYLPEILRKILSPSSEGRLLWILSSRGRSNRVPLGENRPSLKTSADRNS